MGILPPGTFFTGDEHRLPAITLPRERLKVPKSAE